MAIKVMLDEIVREYIDRSVLCWLATVDDNQPSVSPKEVFTYYGDEGLIIANIASPQSVSNINKTDKVCVSFVDVFLQKGFQIYGVAKLISSTECDKKTLATLQKMAGSEFQLTSFIEIKINKIKPILAPSYRINKDMTEKEMIASALTTYGVRCN